VESISIAFPLPLGENMLNLSPQPLFALFMGIAILAWFIWGLLHRLEVARKYEFGLLDVDMSQWYENMFWPLLLLLILSQLWGIL